jgi:subtilase family serine protease
MNGVVALPAAATLAGAFVVAGPVGEASASPDIAGTHPVWATSEADRGEVPGSTEVDTTVYLAGRDAAGMTAYAMAVSDPANAAYQHYLTPDQFQIEYGATERQIASIETWLRGAGLTITSRGTHTISASGTAEATERAYGTQLHHFTVEGTSYRAPVNDARVPASVGDSVLTVTGLDDMPVVAHPASLVGQVTTSLVNGFTGSKDGLGKATMRKGTDGAIFIGPTPCSAYYGQIKDTADPSFNSADMPYSVCGYVPSQLRGAYGVNSTRLTGKGVTVAVVDAYASSTMLADATTYAVKHGDPAFEQGQYTETFTADQWTSLDACGGPAAWAPEETLDVESVHAMATGASVHYFGANSCLDQDFLAVFADILDHRSADIVSDSWGEVVFSATGDEDPALIAAYTHDFQQGAIEGISFQFSSGDCGAEDPATRCAAADASSTPQADFPSSDPWVTSVGGTSLAIDGRDRPLWNTVWGTDAWFADGGVWKPLGWIFGAGGGTSALFAQPAYQRGTVPALLATTLPDGTRTRARMRVTPDVSMDADPTTGFLFGETQLLPDGTVGYAESAIGGTSLACPLFAGLQADMIQEQGGIPVGFANPALYWRDRSAAFTDVAGSGSGATAINTLAPFEADPAIAVDFGDDRLLTAASGFDDATGLGTPSPRYLSSRIFG